MRFVTTLAAAAALTVSGFAAQAGNPAPATIEPPVVVADPAPAPAGSSISSTYVVVGILAALLIAAAVNASEE